MCECVCAERWASVVGGIEMCTFGGLKVCVCK